MTFKTTIALAALLAFPAIEASAATYKFVGSWNVFTEYDDNSVDPLVWKNNPRVYTGQEAAAFLFGGDASDYVISTISNLVADINFAAWLDGWSDPQTYGLDGTPASHDFSLDTSGLGYNGCELANIRCSQSAYSALVLDHGPHDGFVNYAFKIAAVPLPAAGFLLIGAIAGLGLVSRRRA